MLKKVDVHKREKGRESESANERGESARQRECMDLLFSDVGAVEAGLQIFFISPKEKAEDCFSRFVHLVAVERVVIVVVDVDVANQKGTFFVKCSYVSETPL